jgi:dihydroorotase
VHFLHLSTAGSVALVRQAKAAGLPVTAEAAPHHLMLTHAECASYDAVFKVNPPLRTQADVDAVRAGCADGSIDAVATDHAPHEQELKEQAFDEAPPGMLGLETALAIALESLGAAGMSAIDVLALLSWRPAAIAGLDGEGQGGPIAEGRAANLCVIDSDAVWVVDPAKLASRSRNTPYAGRKLTGRTRHTVLQGEPVVVDAEAQR